MIDLISDFDELTISQKDRLTELIFNVDNYTFSDEIVDGKKVVFVTIVNTMEKHNIIDYIKNI